MSSNSPSSFDAFSTSAEWLLLVMPGNSSPRGTTLGNTWSRGQKHGLSKLSDAQAMAIKDAEGTQEEIAASFGVSQSTVSNIKTGRNWKCLEAA